MEKKIEDYLHLYLGCEGKASIIYSYKPKKVTQQVDAKLLSIDIHGKIKCQCKDLHGDNWEDATYLLINEFSPVLRSLCDMTEEEMQECGNLDYDFSDEPDLNKWSSEAFETLLSPNQFIWLLSKHFDLFGLIPAGLAIDKSKIISPNTK